MFSDWKYRLVPGYYRAFFYHYRVKGTSSNHCLSTKARPCFQTGNEDRFLVTTGLSFIITGSRGTSSNHCLSTKARPCFQTGNEDGFLVTTELSFIITGSRGTSSNHCLSTKARPCFQTGNEDWFLVTTEQSLGNLQHITLWHDNMGASPHW